MAKEEKRHNPNNLTRVAVSFPPEVHEKVKRRAEADGVAFSTKALELIKCGLFDYEESERHEPEV